MNDKDNKILSAAYDSFIRYGVKRTTMGDVAQAAGVSRPTLYASYSNKEELLGGVIRQCYSDLIRKIRTQAKEAASIDVKLDIYFEHAILSLYDLTQNWPDAEGVFEFGNQSAVVAYEAALIQQKDLLSELFADHAENINVHKSSIHELSDFTVACANKLKKNVTKRQVLEHRLNTLKIAILAVVETA